MDIDGRARAWRTPSVRRALGARASVLCEARARRPPGAQWKTDLFLEPGTFSTTLSLSFFVISRWYMWTLPLLSTTLLLSLSLFLSLSLSLFLSFSLYLFLSFSLSLFLSFFLSFFFSFPLSLSRSLSLSLPPPLFLYDSIYKDADGQARASL